MSSQSGKFACVNLGHQDGFCLDNGIKFYMHICIAIYVCSHIAWYKRTEKLLCNLRKYTRILT